jgi:hypothetical protein
MTFETFPGRTAAQSGAVQTRGPGTAPSHPSSRVVRDGCAQMDPGSAPHRSASLHAAAHPGNSGEMAPAANGGKARKNDGIVDQDMPPDQRLSLHIVADCAENGGRHSLPVHVDDGNGSRCGAAREGPALVNINENTSAALDGDAAMHGRKAANSLQLF